MKTTIILETGKESVHSAEENTRQCSSIHNMEISEKDFSPIRETSFRSYMDQELIERMQSPNGILSLYKERCLLRQRHSVRPVSYRKFRGQMQEILARVECSAQ